MQDRVYGRKITSVDGTQAAHLWRMDKIDRQLIDSAINILQPVFLHEVDTWNTCFKAEVQIDQQSTVVVRKLCVCCICS